MTFDDLHAMIGRVVERKTRNRETPCDYDPEDLGQDMALAAWRLTERGTTHAEVRRVISDAYGALCGCREDPLYTASGLNIPGVDIVFERLAPDLAGEISKRDAEKKKKRSQWQADKAAERRAKAPSARWRCRVESPVLSKKKAKKLRRSGILCGETSSGRNGSGPTGSRPE